MLLDFSTPAARAPGTGGLAAEALAAQLRDLPSMTSVVERGRRLALQPDATPESLGRFIASDAALALRLLRLANHPLYGQGGRVASLSAAVAAVGCDGLSQLAFTADTVRTLDHLPSAVFDAEGFWRHGLLTALVARALSRTLPGIDEELAFVAGLIHDIGRLILHIALPLESLEALADARRRLPDRLAAEREALGFDHAEVGAALARAWRLPEILCETIAWHHQPERARAGRELAQLVARAGRHAQIEERRHGLAASVDAPASTSGEQLPQALIENVRAQFDGAWRAIHQG